MLNSSTATHDGSSARCRPSRSGRRSTTSSGSGLIPALARLDDELPGDELADTRQRLQSVLNPWLLRSRLWARSWLKPHGFAGDYRMVEWMYELEHDPCACADQPAVVNLLDDLFRSVHSVQAVWHRRGWFGRLIASHVRAVGLRGCSMLRAEGAATCAT